MKLDIQFRETKGTGASRRLRREGFVPCVVYGGKKGSAEMIAVSHNTLYHALKKEIFHSSVLELTDEKGKVHEALLRDYQMHPYKQQVLHADFQRVVKGVAMEVNVPLHFHGQEESPAVKIEKALLQFVETAITVKCLPKDIPENISVDLSALTTDKPLHLSDITLPKNVEAVVAQGQNPVIVTASSSGGKKADDSDADTAATTEAAPEAAE